MTAVAILFVPMDICVAIRNTTEDGVESQLKYNTDEFNDGAFFYKHIISNLL